MLLVVVVGGYPLLLLGWLLFSSEGEGREGEEGGKEEKRGMMAT